MSDLSLDRLTTQLGIADLVTEQSVSFVAGTAINLLAGILTIGIGIWLSRKAGAMTRAWLSRFDRIDKTLIPTLGALVRYSGLTLTFVIALGNFGVETTSIIAVLGAAGIAIGLALQGTLSNVAAGVMLWGTRIHLN